jgi:hypothetical protein
MGSPNPSSYPAGGEDLSLGVKRPGREADHSPPSSAEVEEWVELYFHSPNTTWWRGDQLKSHLRVLEVTKKTKKRIDNKVQQKDEGAGREEI